MEASGGSNIMGQATELGDKLHNNFLRQIESSLEHQRWQRDHNFQREQWQHQASTGFINDLQRRREVAFGQDMQKKQMSMSKERAFLENRAQEYSLRQAIESNEDKERVTKNFMVGMMSAIGSTGGRK